MYSLGSSEALTQFLDQRLGLPFFSDVREELSENTTKHLNKALKIFKFLTFSSKSFLTNLSPAQCGQRQKSHAAHFMMVLKSSEVMPLSGSDRRLMMSGSRL